MLVDRAPSVRTSSFSPGHSHHSQHHARRMALRGGPRGLLRLRARRRRASGGLGRGGRGRAHGRADEDEEAEEEAAELSNEAPGVQEGRGARPRNAPCPSRNYLRRSRRCAPPSPPKAPTPRPALPAGDDGPAVAGLVADEAEAALRGPRGQRALSGKYGLTVEEVHAAGRGAPGESLAFTRASCGTTARTRWAACRGRVRPAHPDVAAKRRLKKKQCRARAGLLPGEAQGPEAHNSIPLERHENASIKLDRAALRPLAAPYFVEWRDVIQPEINRDDLDAMFANLTDADLVGPTRSRRTRS